MSNKIYIAGIHAVESALKENSAKVVRIFLLKNRRDQRLQKILNLAIKLNISIYEKTSDLLNQLVPNVRHQGIIAEIIESSILTYTENDLPRLIQQKSPALFLILDGVQDPHNLGACLRTANAVGVTAVIVPKDRAAALTPTVFKVACGAAETTPRVQVTNLVRTIDYLKQNNIWIYGLAGDAPHGLYNANFNDSIAFVLGNEEKGLRHLTKQHCDYLLHIPMYGTVESLNVSVAAGVCLFEASRQLYVNKHK